MSKIRNIRKDKIKKTGRFFTVLLLSVCMVLGMSKMCYADNSNTVGDRSSVLSLTVKTASATSTYTYLYASVEEATIMTGVTVYETAIVANQLVSKTRGMFYTIKKATSTDYVVTRKVSSSEDYGIYKAKANGYINGTLDRSIDWLRYY